MTSTDDNSRTSARPDPAPAGDARPDTVYLDNAATTRVRPEAVEAMLEVLQEDFGNPSSRHGLGLAAERRLRGAREVLAARMGVSPRGIIFTSGGTEANALAILGTVRRRGRPGHMLVSAVEHPSVLESARMLSSEGCAVELVPVTRGGQVDPDDLLVRLREDTLLVAVMAVNNESGAIQPVAEISRGVRQRCPRCMVLVDGIQAMGSIPLTMASTGAHMISVSAHKIHGPKGVGCLALAADALEPAHLWGGGGQEEGRRQGTENLPGIAGFARAVELCQPDPGELRRLTLQLRDAVLARIPGAGVVGDEARRAPHILGISVPAIPADVLVNLLERSGVSLSSGSACHSRRNPRLSHVMEAMGIPAGHGVIRFSLSSLTGDGEVARAVEAIRGLRLP